MGIIEFIGFLISVIAIFFLLTRKVQQENLRRRHPEEYAKQERQKEKKYREFLKSMDIEVEDEEDEVEFEDEEPLKPLPPPKQIQPRIPRIIPPTPSAVKQTPRSHAHAKPILTSQSNQPSRGKKLIQRLGSRQNIVILYEIMGPPKGSRTPLHHEYWR